MNRTELVKLQKVRHWLWLKELGYIYTSFGKINGLERRAHKFAEDVCNIPMNESTVERKYQAYEREATELFGGELPNGFFINRDPRGYALKIDDTTIRDQADKWQAQGHWPYQDWGGYGILSPEFN
jgi:hypothetical protein